MGAVADHALEVGYNLIDATVQRMTTYWITQSEATIALVRAVSVIGRTDTQQVDVCRRLGPLLQQQPIEIVDGRPERNAWIGEELVGKEKREVHAAGSATSGGWPTKETFRYS